ncbi:endo alpha-1,4 polygalactosaminidase [Streptomyces xiamenensis]|uniref:Endo alpha-1,4 polygalactosaminidase n=1 Tax=Streptomyces xiamenensis TaxID=408015 RepID=A0A0F7FWD9_9ACTN|nr:MULTISPECIES: endo alpha-1,4 polygalactosaminidase [Streptomyces]AKG44598.1 endo alpha-1,4 polygalactosaminidase [Streptomyces xiamenensis]
MSRKPLTVLAASAATLLTLSACSAANANEDRENRAGGPTTSRDTAAEREFWTPEPGTDWQWQLIGTVDTSVDVPVYDIDGFDNSAAVVDTLHSEGRKVICYISVGSWEDWRPDAGDFPDSVIGNPLDEWEGEQWLDVRQLDTLRPLMAARFDMCADKGFDAVEPDNMDGYINDPGFPLTKEDQVAYNLMISELAHERGLSVGLKNGVDQVPELVDAFDFAVNEECAYYKECGKVSPFIEAGKAVFHVEYEMTTEEFCPVTQPLGFSSLQKNWDLDAWRATC